jgi:hypothetical protein
MPKRRRRSFCHSGLVINSSFDIRASTFQNSRSLVANENRSAVHFVLIIGIANFLADFTYEGARGIIGPFLGS